MDHQAFDGLTRSLTASLTGSTTRRGITRLLGGLALGGPLALLGLGEAGATCTKKCGPCKRCKKGKCKGKKPDGTACTGGTCQRGVCIPAAVQAPPPPSPLICPSGTFAVAGRCAPNCGQTCEAKAGVCATTFEGFPYCAPKASCPAVPKTCSSHADCAAQEFCTQAGCGPNAELVTRCVPFLA